MTGKLYRNKCISQDCPNTPGPGQAMCDECLRRFRRGEGSPQREESEEDDE